MRHSQEIKAAGARTMGNGCEGTLGSAVTAAVRFRDELLPCRDAGGNRLKAMATELARSHLGRSLAKLLVSAWTKRFSNMWRPPSAAWLEAALVADLALLAKLSQDSPALAPLQVLQKLLEVGGRDNEPAEIELHKARLATLLGHSSSRLVRIVTDLR